MGGVFARERIRTRPPGRGWSFGHSCDPTDLRPWADAPASLTDHYSCDKITTMCGGRGRQRFFDITRQSGGGRFFWLGIPSGVAAFGDRAEAVHPAQSNSVQPISERCRQAAWLRTARPLESFLRGCGSSPTQSKPVQAQLTDQVPIQAPARGDARPTDVPSQPSKTRRIKSGRGQSNPVQPLWAGYLEFDV